MSRTKNAARNIIWGFTNKVLMLGMPFIFRTALIRMLGAEYLGLNSLFNSILQILNMTELGFTSAVVYSLYKPVAEKNTREICALMQEYRRIYRWIGMVICVAGLMLLPFLKYLVKADIPDDINIHVLYLLYLANTVLSYWLFAYKSVLFDANQRSDIPVNIQSAGFILQYAVQLVFLFTVRNYYAYIIWVPLFTVIRNIMISITVDRMYPDYRPEGEISPDAKKQLKKRVEGLMVQKICAAARNSFDNIVLSALFGLTVVAEYGNYFYILSAVHGLLDVILVAIRPIIGNSIVEESKAKNYEDFMLFQYIFGFFASVSVILLLCLYQPFISIWAGGELLLSDRVMILFCIYFYALTMTDIRTVYDDAAGLWWYGKNIVIIESVLNIVLNVLLGMVFGIGGVVAATVITVVAVNFGIKSRIIYEQYFHGCSALKFYFSHMKYAMITCFAGIVFYNICGMIPQNGISGLTLRFLICAPGAAGVFLCIYRLDDRWTRAKEMIYAVLQTLLRKK